MNGLINSAQVKRYALDYAVQHRHHQFNRVSKEFLEDASRCLKDWIEGQVLQQPSQGKTIR